jgi:transcriptional regulator GlxA family with amidase domain
MHTVGIVVYPDFQALGLAVSTVFEYANILAGTAAGPAYLVSVVSEHGGPIRASQGVTVDSEPLTGRAFDTLMVTGDNQASPPSAGLLRYLRESAEGARRITSICTGAFVLARAGLLDGRRATTHWQYTEPFRAEFPQVRVEEDRLFVVDGTMWTSAGMSAGIDLALALVEADLGVERAREIAKKLVVYNRRSGAQPQQSALLTLDARSDRVQTVLAFAREHLTEDLSVEILADVAHLSRRHFTRLFKEETGHSPAEAIETLRVEAARTLIESGRHSTDEVAGDTGFENPERMRRAFVRAFGKPPQAFQRSARGA